MAYAIVSSVGDKPYHASVLRFLEGLEDADVKHVALVAVCDDGHDVQWYNSDALALKHMAGILDMAAARQLMQEEYYGGDKDEDYD